MLTSLKRILLVEDSTNDVELCLKAFAGGNIVNLIDVVKDGVEAIAYLSCTGNYEDRLTGNPIFILLDLKMARKNGLETLKEIKSTEKLKYIPVIVFTSSKQERDILESYKLGVNAYVVKPVNFEKFIAFVQEIGMFWAIMNQPPVER